MKTTHTPGPWKVSQRDTLGTGAYPANGVFITGTNTEGGG